MAKAIKKCRVCGKPYEACHTARRIDGAFRWQDVACSPECGNIYLSRVMESRSENICDSMSENTAVAMPLTANGSAKVLWDESAEAYEAELAKYFGDDQN